MLSLVETLIFIKFFLVSKAERAKVSLTSRRLHTSKFFILLTPAKTFYHTWSRSGSLERTWIIYDSTRSNVSLLKQGNKMIIIKSSKRIKLVLVLFCVSGQRFWIWSRQWWELEPLFWKNRKQKLQNRRSRWNDWIWSYKKTTQVAEDPVFSRTITSGCVSEHLVVLDEDMQY